MTGGIARLHAAPMTLATAPAARAGVRVVDVAVAIGLLVWAAFAVHLYGSDLAARGFWIDESLTSLASAGTPYPYGRTQTGVWLDTSDRLGEIPPDRPWLAPLRFNADGSMPPLYFQCVHVGRRALGDTDVAIRSFGVVCGLALIPLVYATVRQIGCPAWAAVVAAAVQTLSWFAIYTARDARPYAMASLLACGAILAAIRLCDRPTRGRMAALAALVALMMSTHYFTAAVAAAIAAYAAAFAPSPPARRLTLLAVVVGAAAFAVACGPHLYVQVSNGSQSAWLRDPEAAGHIGRSVAALLANPLQLIGRPFRQPLALDVMFIVSLAGVVAWAARRHRPAALVLLAAVAACAAPLAYDLATQSAGLRVLRYSAFAGPPIAMAVGIAAAEASRVRRAAGVAVAGLLLGFVAMGTTASREKVYPDWREAVAALGDARAGEPIVLCGPDAPMEEACARPDAAYGLAARYLPAGHPLMIVQRPDQWERVEPRARAAGGFWLISVAGQYDVPIPPGFVPDLERARSSEPFCAGCMYFRAVGVPGDAVVTRDDG
jgi:hypothetical protein